MAAPENVAAAIADAISVLFITLDPFFHYYVIPNLQEPIIFTGPHFSNKKAGDPKIASFSNYKQISRLADQK
jgi:hypothetical protein